MGDEGTEPTSNGTLRRIERLERQYDTLSGTVNSMAVDVAVTREKIASVDIGIGNLTAQIKLIAVDRDTDRAAALKAVNEVRASLNNLSVRLAYGAGAVAAAVIILNIFAPAVQKALGLPS